MKRKVGLHKKISAIFDGIPIPKDGQTPPDAPPPPTPPTPTPPADVETPVSVAEPPVAPVAPIAPAVPDIPVDPVLTIFQNGWQYGRGCCPSCPRRKAPSPQ